MDNKDSFFTPDEENNLTLYKDIRNRMIKDMVSKGFKDNRDVRLLNEVLTSAEGSIHKVAELRVKHTDAKNKEAIIDQMREVIMHTQLQKAKAKKEHIEVNPDISDDYIPTDIVPGETAINPTPLDPNQFLDRGDT